MPSSVLISARRWRAGQRSSVHACAFERRRPRRKRHRNAFEAGAARGCAEPAADGRSGQLNDLPMGEVRGRAPVSPTRVTHAL